MKKSCRKSHPLTTNGCPSLTIVHAMSPIDSGQNIHNLGESTLYTNDPFKSDYVCHVLKTNITSGDSITTLSHAFFVRKIQLQDLDTLEDNADEYWLFVPTDVIAYHLSVVTRHEIIQNNHGTNNQITKE